MEPFHDIYRKEEPPFLARHRKRRRFSDSYESPEKNPAQAPAQPPPGADSWREDSGAHHHRRHHHRHDAASRGRLLWILLAGVIAVYAAFLARSVLRGSKKAPAPAEAKPAATAETSATGAVATLFKIDDRIAAWNKVPDAILEAQSLADQGMYEEAENRLTRMLETTPRVTRLQTRLAQTLSAQKKYDRARDVLVEVLETDPNDATAQRMLAGVFERQTNFPAALATARWILETDPNSVEANRIAANAYLNTDRRGQAIPHLRKLVSLDHDDSAVQNRLAVTYTQMGEYVKAIQLFNSLLERNRADLATYYNLSVCYAKQSMAEQAVETLTKAIALFGKELVLPLTQNADFDEIRSDSLFAALVGPEAAATTPPEPPALPGSEAKGTNAPPAKGQSVNP